MIWEMRVKEPVIDFRLLANRNFAIASILFFVFGFGLFGSTTLIPQILQSLYGYRAIDAGLVLGPGALVIYGAGADRSATDSAQDRATHVLLLSSACSIGAAAMWYLQHVHAGNRLPALRAGEGSSGPGIRFLLRARQRDFVLAVDGPIRTIGHPA